MSDDRDSSPDSAPDISDAIENAVANEHARIVGIIDDLLNQRDWFQRSEEARLAVIHVRNCIVGSRPGRTFGPRRDLG